MVVEEIADSSDEEIHELRPLQSSLGSSSAHLRHTSSNSPKRNKSGRRDNDSDDYDEDFADETLQLRGAGGGSLDLDKDKAGEDSDDVEQTLLGGSSPSAVKVAIDSSDPSALVASVVSDTDDPTQTALTARGILIGTFFCILGAGLNQLFFFKSNSPSFSSYFVILSSLPLGRWLARNVPKRRVYLGPWSFELNPGPFSMKEHVLIAVLASSGSSAAFASDIIVIQELYYKQHMGVIASLTLLITTQTLGFGFAGILHDLLVKPIAMVFPRTLATTTMFYTLHDKKSKDTQARLQYFFMFFIAIFIYQFLPSLLMPTLSSIAVLCLVNNRSSAFRILSSGYKGFGIFNISLDWTAISSSGPLYQPWWAALNYFVGIAGAMYIIMPILYFFNFWDAQNFPSPLNASLYQGLNYTKFELASLLKTDRTLDWTKYNSIKPILLTPWFALSYGISFATLTSMLSHIILWHRKEIMTALRYPHHDDIHNRLMQAYPGVPKRWYVTLLIVAMSASVLLVALSPLQLPVWAFFLAISISIAFLVPAGIIRAISDTGIGLNVISELVCGILIPGKPIANVCFKTYSYMTMNQALDLTTDLKLGHYLKIPPRAMFLSQLIGTVIGAIVNLAVVRVVLDPSNPYRGYIDGTEIDPTSQWDGRKINIFYSAATIWGAIGPIEFFSGKYRNLFWGFGVGALLPLVPWLLHKRWPRASWNLVSFPIILHGAALPPQVPNNVITSGFIVAWLSQYYARRNHPKWFARRNFVLASALDAGSSVNALAVFVLTMTVIKTWPLSHWYLNPDKDSEHCSPS